MKPQTLNETLATMRAIYSKNKDTHGLLQCDRIERATKPQCLHLVKKAVYKNKKLQHYTCQSCGADVPVPEHYRRQHPKA